MRRCTSCGAELPGDDVYFRFAIAVQGELDQLQPRNNGAAASPAELIAAMQAESDWQRYADEVHWEAQGVLCARCRTRVMHLLSDSSSQEPPTH